MVESLPQSGPVALPERSFGRLARSVFGYGLVITFMTLSPLVVFVPAALFHCAIRNGRRAAWFAAAIATFAGALFALQVTSFPVPSKESLTLAWASYFAVVLSVTLPALLVTPLVERAESFGRVLALALIGGTLGLVATEYAVHAFTGVSPLAAQLVQAQQTAAKVVDLYRTNHAPAEIVTRMRQWMGYGIAVLPAWLIVDLALIFVLSLMMLGRLRAWREHVTRIGEPAKAGTYLFRNLALPEWVLFAFVFGGLTPITTGLLQKMAANTLAVAVFLFLLQGLAVFRAILVIAGVGLFGTLAALLLLAILVMMGLGFLLVGLAGLFDPFFDFRNIKRKDSSNESHSD